MCGIFGGVKNYNPDKVKVLGILNEDRGTDSSGVFDLDNSLKDVGVFRNFVSKYGESVLYGNKYLIGHTRFATQGAKTPRNAHPFTFGKITGVHNGIIYNFYELQSKYEEDLEVKAMECDSEIIFYLLNKKGLEGLKEIEGYFGLIWKDKEQPNKLFFFQHDCSLGYARVDKKNALYLSSDSADLRIALDINDNIIQAVDDTLYEVDINTLSLKLTKIDSIPDYSYSGYAQGTASNDDNYWNCKMGCEAIEHNHKRNSSTFKDYYGEKSWKAMPEGVAEGSSYAVVDKSKSASNDYIFNCPHCSEQLFIDEVLKEKCSFCHGILSGIVYICDNGKCNKPVMIEEVLEGDCCPYCERIMELDNNHIIEHKAMEV